MTRLLRRAFVPTSEGRLHIRWFGDEATLAGTTPLILLHQWTSSSRMYERLMPPLADLGWSTIAVDAPGFGDSDPPPRPYTVPDYAARFRELLDLVGIAGPVPVLGHHSGASHAIELAVTYEAVVSHLVLSGVPNYLAPDAYGPRWSHQRMQSAGIREIVPRRDGSHLLYEWRRLHALSPGLDLNLLQREFVDAMRAQRYDLAYRSSFDYEARLRFAAISVPTLVIAGTRDVLYEGQKAASEQIAGSDYVEIAGAGVFLMDEFAEAVAERVDTFLRSR